MPESLTAIYQHLKSNLKDAGIDSYDLEARIMIEARLGIKAQEIGLQPEMSVNPETHKLLMDDLRARTDGKPLSRIYGRTQFWGLDFELSSETLDPRLDSETLIDIALKRFHKDGSISILDLGTGSGCLLISLLYEFKNAYGIGVDLSFDAARTAQKNSILNDVADRCAFINANWAESVERKFDLVISNPPYIRSDVIPDLDENVQKYDPILALDGGKDGLQDYKKIFSNLFSLLKPDGTCLFEIGFDQAEDVMRLGKESGFLIKDIHADLSGQPRVVEISCGDK